MSTRFKEEKAKAETYLNNYEKDLIAYFSNPKSYDKLFSELLPIMQEQLKLIDDFRDSTIEIGLAHEITPGQEFKGKGLTFSVKSYDPHYSAVGVKVATNSLYKLSRYKFKDYNDYKEYSDAFEEVIGKFTHLSVGTNSRTTTLDVAYKNPDTIITSYVIPTISTLFTNFAQANHVQVKIKQSANRLTFRFIH